ncbi:hypothetical protein [Wolbachia endosymbiont (group A) of Philonthus cognatus]|uniref:hypothetical protein n=1 Tax=Wolbachia endosymbiont (group A) of Philonthus cognatus TaxID=2954046 RepID=UPI00222E823A|nr:hypothetical protein [Wolbachia endosymbiont (group A) of Philonthus cognatus]
METENQKSTKGLIREAINKELQNIINSADKEQKMRHLENALILKLGLGLCGEIDGGELKHLVFAQYKLKSDNNLSRSQEMVDGIVDEYRGDFEGSGRC